MKLEMRNTLSRSPSLILVFLLAIFCIIRVWSYGQLTSGLDFHEKWEVGQSLMRSSAKAIYGGDNLGYHISTPFLYMLFDIFPSGDYGRDLWAYRWLCLAGSVFAIVILCRSLRYSAVAGLAAIVVFMDWFQPLLSDMRVANVNQIQLALLALFLWLQSERRLRGRNFFGGLVLGFAVMAKPNLLLVVVMLAISWVINRRFKKFGAVSLGMLVATTTAFITSSAVFGSVNCWKVWLTVMPSASDYRYLVDAANFSPSMLIFEWGGIKTSAYFAVGSIAVATIFVWLGRLTGVNIHSSVAEGSERELFEDMLMVAIGCLTYLLSATLVWLHYYLLTIPMALITLRPLMSDDSRAGFGAVVRRIIAAAAIILIAELPIRIVFSVTEPHESAVLLNIGTLTLYGLGMWELMCLRKEKDVADIEVRVGENDETSREHSVSVASERGPNRARNG